MAMTGTRYELRVGTRVSEATLAAFRVPVRPTVVPRSTVYRLRVPADRDLAEVLQLLTERAVQVLEIRRCTEGRRRDGGSPRAEVVEPADASVPGGVVVPFPRRAVEPGG
jgi:hypothetical protein